MPSTSRQAYPTLFCDHRGDEIHLPPKPFAVGGEGAVFEVKGRPDLVAKLYRRPQSKERIEKLRAMTRLLNPELLKIAAWPTATLSVAGGNGSIDGILMPRVADCFEIHHLYSVAQRKKDFPEADWGFLLHTARNCAIAFGTLHAHGHVIGDVNQKNVMVSRKGTIVFVDCDSFQVTEGPRTFRCGVGVPEYTPPELHGKNFANLDRNANHDLFGLAVLIFHLLMMGRHPFSGVPLVKTDIPIEKAIQEGCYAYQRNAKALRLKPPPNAPRATMMESLILDLFDRAFLATHRPTAAEWQACLDVSIRSLGRCRNDPRHSYLPVTSECPWCELIVSAKLMFFVPGVATGRPFQLEEVRRIIQKFVGMELVFAVKAPPRQPVPILVSLPGGLRSPGRKPTPKPIPVMTPIAPPPRRKPYPLSPVELSPPNLEPFPTAPEYPPAPQLGPPDLFLQKTCVLMMVVGIFIMFIAMPVGVFISSTFATWWVLMRTTQGHSRKRLLKKLSEEHLVECDRLDQEHVEHCKPIDKENRKRQAAWQAANEAQMAKYNQSCMCINEAHGRELADWERIKAARENEHKLLCKNIYEAHARELAAWEIANAPWLEEERRWQNHLAEAEAERNKLESELKAYRSEASYKFNIRKTQSQDSVVACKDALRSYRKELKRAEADSRKVQLEEHLDRALIRGAKLKGFYNGRISALESFGIETAKDVVLLKSRQVSGIGPVLSGRLFKWREGIEATFVAKQGLPESEVCRIANRFKPVLLPFVEAVQAAIRDLEAMSNSAKTREREQFKLIESVAQKRAIAVAHLKALNKLP